MKLLILTNNPNRASFRQRIEVYLDTLRTNGVECEVAKLPSGSLSRLKLFKRAADFDGVFLHKKCLNLFDAFCLRKYSKKIIYDFDDAIMYSPKRPASDKSSHFRLFNRTAKLANMVITGNSYLAEHAGRFNRNVEILPTGLDTKEYRIESKLKAHDKIRLVWIGSKSTLRYLKEIKPALEEIGSRFDNVVLRIICDDFFDLENIEVEKCRWSLKSQAFDLISSDIGLAPLSDNRFTRGKCGFKILQYQAANLPTVASPVGVNLEYVRDEVTGYHAQNTRQWVDRISKLVVNADLRKQMGCAAKTQIEKFDSDVIGAELCGLITGCVKGQSKNRRKIDWFGNRAGAVGRQHKPTVSICIPTYNRKEYLRETIDSILTQTYKDYEIVIVDDGSTDGTEDMIKQLGIPVVYHWQENSGDASARNKLIELAKGKYISFLDSDDLLLPYSVNNMVKAIEAEDEDAIVYGSYFRVDQDGNICGRCGRKLYSGNITEHLFQTILVHCCGSMLPQKVLKDTEIFDTSLKVCCDYDLWLRLSMKYRFIALADPTFKRRRHSDNLSVTSFENCLTEFEVLERFYYEKGGAELVPESTAMKVLSKKGRRAGRCAITEGLYEQACKLLGQSFRRCPNPKSLMYWGIALSKWALAGQKRLETKS